MSGKLHKVTLAYVTIVLSIYLSILLKIEKTLNFYLFMAIKLDVDGCQWITGAKTRTSQAFIFY